MFLLLEDLFRRRWWLFLIAALLPFVGLPVGYGVFLVNVVFYGPMLLLGFEGASNATRVHFTLPLSRRTRGRTVWVQSMVLFPVLVLPSWLAGRLLGFDGAIVLPLLLCSGLLCLGFIASILVVMPFLVIRFDRPWIRALLTFIRMQLVALALLALLSFFYRFATALDTSELPAAVPHQAAGPFERLFDIPNTAAMAISLLFIGLSFRLAGRATPRVPGVHSVPDQDRAVLRAPTRFPSRSSALLWSWLSTLAPLLPFWAFLAFGAFAFLDFFAVVTGLDIAGLVHELPLEVVFVTFLLIALMASVEPWLNSVRSLRALPLSRRGLALLFASFPTLALVLTLLLLAVPLLLFGLAPAVPILLDWALLTFAITLFGCSLHLQSDSVTRIAFLFGVIVACAAVEAAWTATGIRPMYFHIATVLIAPWIMVSGVRRLAQLVSTSSEVYRRPPLVAGQPMNRH